MCKCKIYYIIPFFFSSRLLLSCPLNFVKMIDVYRNKCLSLNKSSTAEADTSELQNSACFNNFLEKCLTTLYIQSERVNVRNINIFMFQTYVSRSFKFF